MKAMGIRIHKVLGYGLTNAKEHLILEYSTHPFWNTNLKTRDVYEWSQKLGEHQANASLIHREAPDELSDLIHYDAENGDENTLIITMPNDRWYRYDDDIDHNEYNLHYQGVEPVTTVLNHRAPYPYTFFRNVDTGENVGMDEFTSICSNFGLNGWGKHGVKIFNKKVRDVTPQTPPPRPPESPKDLLVKLYNPVIHKFDNPYFEIEQSLFLHKHQCFDAAYHRANKLFKGEACHYGIYDPSTGEATLRTKDKTDY